MIREKLKVILDTDIGNQIDDQFALAYLLANGNLFDLEAVTLEPYIESNESIKIKEGLEKSYKIACEIFDLMNVIDIDIIHKGSINYMINGYEETNEAVDNIIKIAMKNEKTYVLAIGVATNIALAIKKEPKIKQKIEIIWLGTNSVMYKNNNDSNFKKDILAAKYLIKAKNNLTIIPCKNVASHMAVSIYEVEHFFNKRSKICQYLYDILKDYRLENPNKGIILWDLSVIAYLANKKWFETEEMYISKFDKENNLRIKKRGSKVNMVKYLNRFTILDDFFDSLVNY